MSIITIPQGYKQTNTGLIPEDWDDLSIGRLIDFEGGSQPDKRVFISQNRSGYIRLIQIRDYKSDRFEVYAPVSLMRRFCDASDIMIGRYGPPVFQILRGLSGAYNVALIKAIPKNQMNKDFAYYFLKQDSLFEFIDKLSRRSSGQTGVDLVELKSYPLGLPPLAEQTAIAEALSDADALIESLEQLIDKKRLVKQGAMQELLTGKRRLPGFEGEWEVKKLGEIGNCFAGGTPSTLRDDYWGGDILWLPSGRVQNNVLHTPDESDRILTFKGLDESAARMIKKNSVLIAITGATCANIAALEFDASANQSVVAIEPIQGFHYRFIYYSLLMERAQILSYQTGSAQGGVNLKAVKSLQLKLPIHTEQTAIATILSEMDNEISDLEGKLEKARQVKQGMMQNLLTGKVRLV